MKNMTIDDAIQALTELKAKMGGNVPLVMPTGETEDDIDKYIIYSYIGRFWPVVGGPNGTHVVLDKSKRAFKE